jgi:hypothetical protein
LPGPRLQKANLAVARRGHRGNECKNPRFIGDFPVSAGLSVGLLGCD